MALDLSAVTRFPVIKNVTLSATPGNTTLIKLPTGSVGPLLMRIRSRANGSKLLDPAQAVTDGTAIGLAEYATLPADTNVEFRFAEHDGWALTSTGGVSIASASASVVVEVTLYTPNGI